MPTGTATFDTTGISQLSLSTSSASVGTIQFDSGSNNFFINLNGKTLTLTSTGIVDNSAATISFSGGTIAGGGGVQQLGTGTLILSGTDTYSGSTTVSGGTLQVDGSLASGVQATAGGTLSGTGTLGSVLISRATLAPGTPADPTGTLTVKGSLTLSANANYQVTINGGNLSNSTTNVIGGVTLSGLISVIAAPGTANSYSAADTFTLLTSQGLSRSFSDINVSGSFGNFAPVLTYTSNNAVLGLTAGTTWLGTTATSGTFAWNTAANWAGGIVPVAGGITNEPATGVATFTGSASTTVTVNGAAGASTLLFTSGVTSPYTFVINQSGLLLLTGSGIADNSSHPPVFVVGSATLGLGSLEFQGGATAGDAVIINNSGGTTTFGVGGNGLYTSTAGTANITNNSGGSTVFNATTTAGSATITTNSGGSMTFNANSTGGNAILITNTGGVVNINSNGPFNSPDNITVGAIEGTGGSINLGIDTLTITAGIAGTSFAGAIGGAALDIAGGTTTLSGTNTYNGATVINGGTLAVNGSIATSSGVTVNSGGTLTGTGTVPGVNVAAGGTLAPGFGGAGTLKINGNLSLASGSDYAVTLNDVSNSNTAAAVTGTGKATLGGTLTAVASGGTYSAADTYTVLTAAAATGVSGTFSGLAISGTFGDLVPVLTYNANNVQIGLTGGTLWNGTTTDWNTGSNWAGLSVPSSTGVAAFNASGNPTVTVSAATQIGTMLFYGGAQPFTFNINSTLTLNGIGVVDNSGIAQAFNVGGSGSLIFKNSATAGDAVITINSGGLTQFTGNSTGGTAQFTANSGGVVDFSGTTGPNGNGIITAGSIAGAGNYYLGSNTLTVGNSSSTTVSGVISPCGVTGNSCSAFTVTPITAGGSLIKVGSGTLTLGGVNTYTGATTISAGALALSGTGSIANSSGVAIGTGATFDISGTSAGALITTLSGQGKVTLGAETLTITNGNSTFAGVISGNGALAITGGTEILSGINTYGGGTTITGGTLSLASANAIAGNISLGVGGTFIGNFDNTINATGVALTGGTLESVGGTAVVNAMSGTTTLSGTNTYIGATTIASSAIVTAGGPNALSPNSPVTDNGTLDLGSTNQTIAQLNGTNAAALVTNLSNPTGFASAAVLTVSNGGTFAGVIANGALGGVTTGLDLTGGTLTLSGTNTYTGATTVNGGVLSVIGSIAKSSGVSVNSGVVVDGVAMPSVLAGTGTVPTVTVNAGGTLAPGTVGSPTGTLTVNGNLTLATGADYLVDVDGGSSGKTVVSAGQTASLNGVFTAVGGGGAYTGSPYTVLSATSGVSGTFSGINLASGVPGFGNFVPYLTYTSNSVQLILTAGNNWLGTSSTNWNTGNNWTSGVPTGISAPATSVATFSSAATSTTISVNAPGTTVGTMLFSSVTPASGLPFTFNINGGNSLILNGVGIDDNDPAHPPVFNVGTTGSGNLQFQNAATAGDAIINVTSGSTQFLGNSTGGSAQFNITAAGGTVDFSGTLGPNGNGVITVGSIAGAGNYELGSNQLTITGGQTTTVSGVISNCALGCLGNANGSTGGSLVLAGGGTLTLSGANTYSGGTILTSGTLVVDANNTYVTQGVPTNGIQSSAIGTGTLTFNGGTLQAAGAFTVANAVLISVAKPGDPGGIIDAHGNTFVLAGNIADDPAGPGGMLTIANTGVAGAVVFSGMNSYSGATTINSGATLQGGAPDALSNASAVTVNGTLDLGGFNQAIAGLSGGGTVTNSGQGANVAATLTVDGGTSTTFSGAIMNGSGATGGVTGLAVTGNGTVLTLNGTNSYTGATTIGAGATLTLSGTSIVASSGVINNGTFDISSNGATTITALSGTSSSADVNLPTGSPLTISGGSTASPYYGAITGAAGSGLTVGSGGALALFGNSTNTYSGTTTIDSGGTLQVGANGALGASTNGLTFNGGGTLQAGANNLSFGDTVTLGASGTFDTHGDTLTWTGLISGNTLNVVDSVGGGMLVVSGVSDATTNVGVTGGSGGSLSVVGNLASTTGVNVNSGGTLSGTGTITTPSLTIATGGILSPGNGSLPTTIQTLTIAGNGTLAFNPGSIYAVTLNGSNYTTTDVTGTGTANLTGGTLTIGGTASSLSATILTASSIGGTKFSAVNITGSFGDSLPNVVYSSNSVSLNLIAGIPWQGSTSAGGSEWSTPANWVGGTVPTGINTLLTSVAAFDATKTINTSVTISSSDTNVTVGTLLFNSNIITSAQAITFTIASGGKLTLDGDGVVNESTSTTPTFNVAGTMVFTNNSNGGNAQYNLLSGGVVDFSGSSGNSQLSGGSISGTAGSIYLGSGRLAVGSNNLSTTFGGVISDCGTGGTQCSAYTGTPITGGSLNKVGTGTLVLSGQNTYTGGTTITAGILQATNTKSIGGGALTFNGGTFQTSSSTKSLSFSNNILVNTTGGTFDTFGNTVTWTGNISNGNGAGGFTVADSVGSGTLILSNTGTYTSYTGALTVNSGTLEVDGSVNPSSLTVNGGTLSGTGTIANNVTFNGGTLSPGSIATPTGTLTINGSLTLTSASFYMVSISGSSNSMTSIAGSAGLNGAILLVNANSSIKTGTPYTLLTTGTGVTGTFNTQAAYASANGPVQATLSNPTTKSIAASFSPAQLNPGVLPSGYGSFASAINALSNQGKLSNNFIGLFNSPANGAAGLSGLSNSAAVPALANMQTSFATTLLNPNIGSRGGTPGSAGGGFGPALGFAPDTPQTPGAQGAYDAMTPRAPLDAMMRSLNTDHNYSVWASVYGGISKFDGDSNTGSQTVKTDGVGIASGIDYRLGPNTVVGFALGGGGTSWSLANGLGGGNSDIFQAGFYGSQKFGNFYLSGALAYALDAMSINRNVTAPLAANLTSNFDANGGTGRIEGGYRYSEGQFGVTPYLAGEFSAMRTPAFNETTASGTPGFALSYAGETATNERAELGVWGDMTFGFGEDARMRLGARVGYAHDWWSDDTFTSNFVSLPTQSFTLTGVTPPANLGLATLLSEIRYANGMSFGVKIDGEIGSGAYSLAGTGTFRYSW